MKVKDSFFLPYLCFRAHCAISTTVTILFVKTLNKYGPSYRIMWSYQVWIFTNLLHLLTFLVLQVICSVCDTEQPAAQVCSNCGVNMGEYFCSICIFYDDDVKNFGFSPVWMKSFPSRYLIMFIAPICLVSDWKTTVSLRWLWNLQVIIFLHTVLYWWFVCSCVLIV